MNAFSGKQTWVALPLLALLIFGSGGSTLPALAAQTGIAATPVSADPAARKGFDFYVFALSWSPSYCLIAGARANRQQCDAERDLGFVVHGLWPQYKIGYPEFCPSGEPERVPSRLGRNYLDLFLPWG